MPLPNATGMRTHVGGVHVSSSGLVTNQGAFRSDARQIQSTRSPGPPFVRRNQLWLRKESWTPGRLNVSHTTLGESYSNWKHSPGLPSNGAFRSGSDVEIPTALVTAVLAATNPTQSVVSLPNFLWELKEFPQLFRDLGRVLDGRLKASDVPHGYLAWQFGWEPLKSDLGKLVNLAHEIEDTARRFNGARQSKTMRGSFGTTNDRVRASSTVGTVFRSSGVFARSIRRWWTAHWDSASTMPDFRVDGAFSAYGRALGLGQPMVAVWNAIPWSFLVDYFLNVGTFLEASSGGGQYAPAEVCIMQHVKINYEDDSEILRSSFVGEFTPTQYKFESKRRLVVKDPKATIRFFPYPLADRLGILASLSTASALRASQQDVTWYAPGTRTWGVR